jgi:putative transposase
VVQRGNNRQVCFADDADLKAYAHWLREGAERYGVKVHAWVFMTNHVHLLVTPEAPDSISCCMQYLGRYYVRRFNYRYQRSGTLFEGRFRSSIVQDSIYLLVCQRYIELNPVRAGLVADPADYTWSSYRAHAFGRSVGLWRPHSEYLALGETPDERRHIYQQYFEQELSVKALTDIRAALNTGLALGNDRFKAEVQQLTGQPQRLKRRGPQPFNGGINGVRVKT